MSHALIVACSDGVNAGPVCSPLAMSGLSCGVATWMNGTAPITVTVRSMAVYQVVGLGEVPMKSGPSPGDVLAWHEAHFCWSRVATFRSNRSRPVMVVPPMPFTSTLMARSTGCVSVPITSMVYEVVAPGLTMNVPLASSAVAMVSTVVPPDMILPETALVLRQRSVALPPTSMATGVASNWSTEACSGIATCITDTDTSAVADLSLLIAVSTQVVLALTAEVSKAPDASGAWNTVTPALVIFTDSASVTCQLRVTGLPAVTTSVAARNAVIVGVLAGCSTGAGLAVGVYSTQPAASAVSAVVVSIVVKRMFSSSGGAR